MFGLMDILEVMVLMYKDILDLHQDSSVTNNWSYSETQIHTREKLVQIVMDLVHLVLQTLLVVTAQHYR